MTSPVASSLMTSSSSSGLETFTSRTSGMRATRYDAHCSSTVARRCQNLPVSATVTKGPSTSLTTMSPVMPMFAHCG
eukprot:CAMPEP_0118924796 /NCGR_PEP_ID=MMETSP1169-20130426/2763_1 /TAXON_ID=36882 /ORGANISM="Pyramimonas obovata, Strain CCMP722" /LENGTH=76 /DNA_ID=CAMNT_0006865929 /DNA_START=238 /DNA_END=468 /DNA_ORIENTATION=+